MASPESPAPLTGGCLCQTVRFEIAAVFDCRYCHCAYCRHSTGAPFSVEAVVKREDFRLTSGDVTAEPRTAGTAYSCVSCRHGAYFEFETEIGVFASVPVGFLDDPDACPPRAHQCFAGRLRWMHVHDTLPKYASGRIPHPDRRRS